MCNVYASFFICSCHLNKHPSLCELFWYSSPDDGYWNRNVNFDFTSYLNSPIWIMFFCYLCIYIYIYIRRERETERETERERERDRETETERERERNCCKWAVTVFYGILLLFLQRCNDIYCCTILPNFSLYCSLFRKPIRPASEEKF